MLLIYIVCCFSHCVLLLPLCVCGHVDNKNDIKFFVSKVSGFAIISLMKRELNVLLLVCLSVCLSVSLSLSLSRSVMGWSMICEYYISWSYSVVLCKNIC